MKETGNELTMDIFSKGLIDFIRLCVYDRINIRCGGIQMLDYILVEQASEKWEISKRRIQKLCEESRIDGVIRFGRSWAIPKDAEKPVDARKKQVDMGGKNEK